MKWHNWNDQLSLLLLLGVPLFWLGIALLVLRLKPEGTALILGALVGTIGTTSTIWTLVAQYYFRKSPNGGPPDGRGGISPPQ